MVRRRLLIGLIMVVLFGSACWQSSQAQGGEEYFDETGHVVAGEFLTAYHSVPNPVELYGYPITDAFQDSTRNLLVQYFQKTRFELDPAGVFGKRVKISPLGEYLYVPGQEAVLLITPGACQTFPPDGYRVCYSFLDFYNSNGGEKQFGLPISNAEERGDRTVQYFQNARFEWLPGRPDGKTVFLSDLGSQYFNHQAEDPTLLLPNRGGNIINSVRSLRVRAYPIKAVTGKTGSQTIYVMVQDQRLLPVENAVVTLILSIPGEQPQRLTSLPPTNEAGFTQISFPFSADQVGVAAIQVVASRGDLQSDTTTSFRVWW